MLIEPEHEQWPYLSIRLWLLLLIEVFQDCGFKALSVSPGQVLLSLSKYLYILPPEL